MEAEANPTDETDETQDTAGVSGSSEPVETGSKGLAWALLHTLTSVRGILVVAIVGCALGLVFWLNSERPVQPDGDSAVLTSPEPVPVEEHQEPEQVKSQQIDEPQVGLSWKLAEKAYATQKYDLAMQGFRRLLPVSQVAPVNERVSDFFRLRIAQCLRQLGQPDEARVLFRSLSGSSSPIVSAAASYAFGELELENRQYLQARTWVYRAIAKLGSVDNSLPLENDCDFLIARALTEKVLSFYSGGPEISWVKSGPKKDIFANLDEKALRLLLEQGCENYALAILGPRIRKEVKPSGDHQWSVSATQSSLEGLLGVFATRVATNVRWISVASSVRARPVTLSYSGSSDQRLFEISCGMTGLLARFTGDEVIVHDPHGLASVSQQRDLLLSETISAWRRLFLRLPEDPKVAHGHLALAVLYELSVDTASALSEYQLTSNRFVRSRVAPLAMLRCAKLRIRLRDYVGARKDLLDLVDRYPDCDSLDEVYLSLGQANMDGGNLDQAIRVLNKLYYLGLSRSSKVQSCLIMSKCFYRQGKYDQACEWLGNYFKLAKDLQADELAETYILLAKCEAGRGETENAARALAGALAAGPNSLKHTQALLELTRIQAEQQCFDDVVTKLSRITEQKLSPAQKQELLLLTANVYRTMGLSERAATILKTQIPIFTDRQMQATLGVELAHCYVDLDELDRAAEVITEVLLALPSGSQKYRAMCDLAEICLKLNNPEDAITVATELLNTSCGPGLRQKARRILGSAHVSKHDYQSAALALAGLLPKSRVDEDEGSQQ